MKNNTCCFTGHRVIPSDIMEELKEKTYNEVKKLIEAGVDTFICGGAIGYDTMAALIVLRLKEKYPNIKLVIAIPCESQPKYFSAQDKKKYFEILERADEKVYVSREYSR